MAEGIKRSRRVADRIREELMNMLLRGELRDPAAQYAHVSHVELTDDLRHARVYVRRIEPEVDELARKALMKALERAKGFVRRELGHRLALRYTPELVFFWDDQVDEALKVEGLLREIERDRSGGSR